MNKFVVSLVIVAVLAAALGTAGVAFAQGQAPVTPQNPGYDNGAGMAGGRGMRAGMMGARPAGSQIGILHEEIVAVFAEKLGLTVEALNARLAEGETVAQVAFAQGFTAEQFQALMEEARYLALDQAVAEGQLSQEQADWMEQRGFRGMGGRSAGQGRFANPACPYYSQVNP